MDEITADFFSLVLSQELQREKLGRMQESDYFEDFGEGNEDNEDNESEKPTTGKKGKKVKSKGKDKLMGELEFLALGEDDKVANSTTAFFEQILLMTRVQHTQQMRRD